MPLSRLVRSLAARPWLAAAGWLALLGPAFFVVYGWCNAVSAGRPHVGSFYFAWERHIPFVPWMIVPYLSIDLFFAGSFFLCRDRAQLRTHAARIGLAILISAAVFLLCPLRYGWPRPAVGGWLGTLFAPLNALDQPYNLCPSLHISLRTILWTVYRRRLRERTAWRLACAGWFTLIGVSTLLVYQHHVVDLLGGYAVALVCCRCFPQKERLPAHTPVLAGLAGFVKLLAGVGARWIGCRPDTRQRIYFANHTSHLDAFVLWSALRPDARARVRPVAARDYWMNNPVRRFLAGKIFRAVFVDRRHEAVRHGNPIEPLLGALASGQSSLILFPEGTRGAGPDAGPFKSGLYYLAKQRPDVELVPAFIEHLGRVLPDGVRFGAPLRLEPDEDKFDFLSRARAAVNGLRTA